VGTVQGYRTAITLLSDEAARCESFSSITR
jgi:hypothetical protein